MQFKLVPAAPDDLEFLETVQRALPLVPGTENDCCARIMRQTDIAPRDEARTWLTFLRALELAEEGPSGFTRTRREPEPDRLSETYRERLYGVDVLLEILEEADDPLSSAEVFDRFRGEIPAYEQYRWSDRLDAVWSERVERLLEWAVLFDLLERADGEYRSA